MLNIEAPLIYRIVIIITISVHVGSQCILNVLLNVETLTKIKLNAVKVLFIVCVVK